MRVLPAKLRQVTCCFGAAWLVWGCDRGGAASAGTVPPRSIAQVVQPLRTRGLPAAEREPLPGDAKRSFRPSVLPRDTPGTRHEPVVIQGEDLLDEAITAEHLEAVLNRLQDRIERGE